jgi:hypothetical protein
LTAPSNEGVTILGRSPILNQAVACSGSQKFDAVEMATVKFERFGNAILDMWRSDAMRNTRPSEIPPEILAAIESGHMIYAEVRSPRQTPPTPNAFTQTWQRIAVRPEIPFDTKEREQLIATAMPEIAQHIQKWSSLKSLDDNEIHRRFGFHQTGIKERM